MKKIAALMFLGLVCLTARAQEDEVGEKKHRVTFLLSHTWVNTVADEGVDFAALPSFGLNYDFWINERFAIGLHNDLIGQTFFVDRIDNNEVLERELPWATVAVAIYKFENGLAPLIGAGVEIEKSESLPMVQVGMEYGKEFSEVWEVGVNLTYDFKIEAYDSFAFGLSISRKL